MLGVGKSPEMMQRCSEEAELTPDQFTSRVPEGPSVNQPGLKVSAAQEPHSPVLFLSQAERKEVGRSKIERHLVKMTA